MVLYVLRRYVHVQYSSTASMAGLGMIITAQRVYPSTSHHMLPTVAKVSEYPVKVPSGTLEKSSRAVCSIAANRQAMGRHSTALHGIALHCMQAHRNLSLCSHSLLFTVQVRVS